MGCRCGDISRCEGDIAKLRIGLQQLDRVCDAHDEWLADDDAARGSEYDAYELSDEIRGSIRRTLSDRRTAAHETVLVFKSRATHKVYDLENDLAAMRSEDQAHHAALAAAANVAAGRGRR